jgi:hypothetical protein
MCMVMIHLLNTILKFSFTYKYSYSDVQFITMSIFSCNLALFYLHIPRYLEHFVF